MNRRTPTAARITAFSAAALALGACSADGGSEDAEDGAEARGSYDIDPATGETRAEYTGDDGTTTTLRSGEKVPVALPAGFTIYPEARVTNNTRVEQGAGQLVLVTLESEDTPEQMVAHYRAEAEAAQIDVATSLSSDATMMIGGEDADGTSFSFTATREEDVTQAQLSVARGLE